MLGATQAVLLGAAGCPFAGYAATVTGIPGLLAYWRFSNAATIVDATAGNRDGTYDGSVSLVPGLPMDSDAATDLSGTVSGTVTDDPGLQLAALSLSLWFSVDHIPDEEEGRFVVISKDQIGLILGDFAISVDDTGELTVQFQTTGVEHRLNSPIVEANTTYHLCIRADSTGFDAYLDGKYIGKSIAHTDAWFSNSQPIQFGTAPWTSTLADIVIDEVALYSRVLTEAEVIALAQRDAASPVAVDDVFAVTEETTVVLDVVENDVWVGQKANLIVEVVSQGSFGNAIVRGDNDIDFEADAVIQDEADSFTYRITDSNGQSEAATVNLTIQNAASQGGGALVYRWGPLAEWIDGMPLSSRDKDVVEDIATWNASGGASVGGSLVQSISIGGSRRYCFNRAPSSHPSLEIFSPEGASGSPANLRVRLFNGLDGDGPRHLRVVMEVKTCKSSDSTTHKSAGLGPTGGSYTNWRNSHEPWTSGKVNCATKYFIGLWGGSFAAGALNDNWYANHTFPIDAYSDRWQPGANGKAPLIYSYGFNRPGAAGGWDLGANPGGSGTTINDSGVHGVWHRVEIEAFLCTPALVPNGARRSDPEQSRPLGGDGFVKHWLTKDIDGELGTPGTRQLVAIGEEMIQCCKFDDTTENQDNMHQLLNLVGPWVHLAYGGSAPANVPQRDAWGWIRKIEVYRHD